MKKNLKTTKKLDKKLKKHTALVKNGSSIRNVGIKRVKLLISLYFFLSEICPYFVQNMSKSSSKLFVRKLLSEFLKSETCPS